MPNINLLPENKRYREAKEKSSSKAMNFSVSLTEAEKKKSNSSSFWASNKKNPVKPGLPEPKKIPSTPFFGREKHQMALPRTSVKADYLVPKIAASQKVGRLLAEQAADKLKEDNKIKAVFLNQIETKPKIEPKPAIPATIKKTVAENHKPERGEIMPKVNLIPEELIFNKHLSLVTKLSILILIMVLSGGVVFGAYYLINSNQLKVKQIIVEKTANILSLNEKVAANNKIAASNIYLQQKLLAIKDNLDTKILWSKFFELLEKYTLETVYYTSFSADTSGLITLPAVASDYNEAAKQIVALQQASDFTSQVITDSATLSSSQNSGGMGVSFVLKIKLADNVFKK